MLLIGLLDAVATLRADPTVAMNVWLRAASYGVSLRDASTREAFESVVARASGRGPGSTQLASFSCLGWLCTSSRTGRPVRPYLPTSVGR